MSFEHIARRGFLVPDAGIVRVRGIGLFARAVPSPLDTAGRMPKILGLVLF